MMNSSAPLRFAIIGLGKMGQNHLRVLETIKAVEIAAVVDTHYEQAKAIASRIGCKAFSTLEPLIGLVDAAIVAVPSVFHYEVGKFLLASGVHCLIEKPLASTEEECQGLIDAAKVSQVILMVGHTERFNPAVQLLQKYLKETPVQIFALEARRMNDAGIRITDVDVVADLMMHDIDVVCALNPTGIQAINGFSQIDAKMGSGNYVNAFLQFNNGSTASFIASRITQNRIRDLFISTDRGSIQLDYLTQKLYLFHKNIGHSNFACDYARESLFVRYEEPLPAELKHFIDSIQSQKKPLIDGENALETMRIVWQIQKKIRQ